MKKKLFRWLSAMAVLIFFLHSCVHDEIYSSSDSVSREYTNKSLWKQDEKYIKNVMQVYFEHESEIKKINGTPLWDYATSVNHFDESFLMVPVVENGKVVSVLQVPRGGNKIYFHYSNYREQTEFFQGIIFGKYRKIENQEAANKETICSRQSISMWFPDDNNNPDGSGHWETRFVIVCRPVLDQCVGIINEFGECSNSGGDGGFDYPGGGSGGSNPEPEEPKTPCEKTKNIINNAKLKSKIDELKVFAQTAIDDEKGYQQDKSGNINPAHVDGKHHVDFVVDQNSVGGIHNHTLTGIHMFSPNDILSLLSFATVQNYTLPIGSTADNTGDAFVGMISQSGSYYINFSGGSSALPPQMTEAEQNAYLIKMNDAYLKLYTDIRRSEGISLGDNISDVGLQKLFFGIIKEMNLDGKVNLIKEDNGNTSAIQQNSDGTPKAPMPC